MICRYSKEENYVRISALSKILNVKPSSSSKMVNKLKELDLVEFEKYGIIKPTSKGWDIGNYLLYRHDMLHSFFCMINHSTDELEQVEQVEHFINEQTVRNIELLLEKLNALLN
jgi:Mn-dependent DtxR family transcriptional regulator